MKTIRNFLSAAVRADLVAIARDGLEEHRIARRANAILLLDQGWSYAEVAEALFLNDSTIRIWLREFQEGGVEAIVLFDLKGGTGRLSPLQIDELRAWATQVLPTSTTEIGQFILDRFGFDYGRSGLIKLMNRIGFDWKKPESVPGKIDVETQQKFIDAHEDLRNSLGPDEMVVYVDAVHPTHQAKPAGRWLPRGQRCALPAASGRDRLNLHGAIDLETGQTRFILRQAQDEGCPDRRRGKHDRLVRGAGGLQFDDEPHPCFPRQRPLPPRQSRHGLAATAREAHRPALRAVILSAPHPERVEGSTRSSGSGR